MKNCGDVVHAYVVERNVLKEMVKIAKKKVSFLLATSCTIIFLIS
jgi:hypothetical protein